MQSRVRKVIRWHIRCKDHGGECLTYVMAGTGYGDWMGRTPCNELAEFDLEEDPVFDEVAEIVKDLLCGVGREPWAGRCVSQVLGVACDPAPSGYRYSFAGRYQCPVCGSSNVTYGPDVPPQAEVIDLPHVTHEEWQGMDEAEKRERIRRAIDESGCLPEETPTL